MELVKSNPRVCSGTSKVAFPSLCFLVLESPCEKNACLVPPCHLTPAGLHCFHYHEGGTGKCAWDAGEFLSTDYAEGC